MKNSPIAIILIFLTQIVCGQNIDSIVSKIAKIDEVQYEFIGLAGKASENYSNFLNLKKNTDNETLLKLIDHKNPVVSCYAGWALIDKDYQNLPSIFSKFLKSDKSVRTFSGCIISENNLSSEFYHRIWGKTEDKKSNQLLETLDSLIIYSNNPDWLLLTRALENRVHPKEYNNQIANLAFKENYKEAIIYFSNWYKAEYKEQIQKALLKYLKRTNFRSVGTSAYYNIVDELLKFNDNEITDLVIEKLKKDRHWEYSKDKFKYLLEEYNIYESDLKK